MKTTMKTKNRVNVDYVIGLIETDGSFQIHFSGNDTKPLIKISQKTNTNTLGLIKEFLIQHGLTCTIASGQSKKVVDTSKGRAPSLLVTGKNNVKTLLNLLKQGTKTFVFASVKQRDFLIMTEIVTNETLTKAQLLGLKKSLHKANRNQPDLVGNGAVPREKWEQRFGLTKGDSTKSCESILKRIDENYKVHQLKLERSMEEGTLKVSPAYIAGLVDGDGGYYVTVSFREPTRRYNKRMIEWQGNFNFTMEVNAKLTVKVLLYAIESTATINALSSAAVQVLVRKQADVDRLIQIHEQFPLIGDYKQQELDTVIQLRALKQDGSIKNYQVVCNFLDEIYRVSAISLSGPPRRLTLEEAKSKALEWLS